MLMRQHGNVVRYEEILRTHKPSIVTVSDYLKK